jgi:hypothetical protein
MPQYIFVCVCTHRYTYRKTRVIHMYIKYFCILWSLNSELCIRLTGKIDYPTYSCFWKGNMNTVSNSTHIRIVYIIFKRLVLAVDACYHSVTWLLPAG